MHIFLDGGNGYDDVQISLQLWAVTSEGSRFRRMAAVSESGSSTGLNLMTQKGRTNESWTIMLALVVCFDIFDIFVGFGSACVDSSLLIRLHGLWHALRAASVSGIQTFKCVWCAGSMATLLVFPSKTFCNQVDTMHGVAQNMPQENMQEGEQSQDVSVYINSLHGAAQKLPHEGIATPYDWSKIRSSWCGVNCQHVAGHGVDQAQVYIGPLVADKIAHAGRSL